MEQSEQLRTHERALIGTQLLQIDEVKRLPPDSSARSRTALEMARAHVRRQAEDARQIHTLTQRVHDLEAALLTSQHADRAAETRLAQENRRLVQEMEKLKREHESARRSLQDQLAAFQKTTKKVLLVESADDARTIREERARVVEFERKYLSALQAKDIENFRRLEEGKAYERKLDIKELEIEKVNRGNQALQEALLSLQEQMNELSMETRARQAEKKRILDLARTATHAQVPPPTELSSSKKLQRRQQRIAAMLSGSRPCDLLDNNSSTISDLFTSHTPGNRIEAERETPLRWYNRNLSTNQHPSTKSVQSEVEETKDTEAAAAPGETAADAKRNAWLLGGLSSAPSSRLDGQASSRKAFRVGWEGQLPPSSTMSHSESKGVVDSGPPLLNSPPFASTSRNTRKHWRLGGVHQEPLENDEVYLIPLPKHLQSPTGNKQTDNATHRDGAEEI